MNVNVNPFIAGKSNTGTNHSDVSSSSSGSNSSSIAVAVAVVVVVIVAVVVVVRRHNPEVVETSLVLKWDSLGFIHFATRSLSMHEVLFWDVCLTLSDEARPAPANCLQRLQCLQCLIRPQCLQSLQ